MHMSFQLSNLAWRAGVLFACASLSPLLFPASLHCDPYASTWASGQKSSLRLIAAGGAPPQSFYRAGIEVRLDPGALTYWRMPGGAGVPPVFSFEGSANASDIVVSYPVPLRIDEDGTEAFGYRDRVIFPVRVTPKDATRPVLLVLNVSYAVCSRICLPAKAEARLALLPAPEAGTETLGPDACRISSPKPPQAGISRHENPAALTNS
jgi:DsbC/DsbD-like thiol-disulfide interchange protein